MKTKRILSALLVLTVTLALLPNVVFAGDDYNIINGTPENDVTKNHGYITIDKATAAENDTVTVTVNPADGYQLKSLVATPVAPTISTIADVLATVEEFPTSEDQTTPPSSAWVADVQNSQKCYAYTSVSGSYTALLLRIPSVTYTFFLTTTEVTPGENCYTASNNLGTLEFNMTDGVLTGFTYTHNEGKPEGYDGTYAPASTPSPSLKPIKPADQQDGTYQFTMPGYPVTVTAEFEEVPVTIADILPSNFPASDKDNSWRKSDNDNVYIYKTDSNLVFNDSTEDCYSVALSSPLTKEENPEVSYVYSKDETEIQFNMTGDNDDELENIVVNNCTIPTCIGTYNPIEIVTYDVTYNANGATSGSAPANQTKTASVDLTLATNTGNLAKAGYTFAGWNTKADGSGTHYDTGATYTTDAALTLYAEWIEAPATKTIDDILPDNFPTYSGGIPSNAWKNSAGSKMYINNNGLTFGGVSLYNILSTPVTKNGNNYKCISNPYTITFVMDSGKLVKVIIEGAESADNNGEYIPSHTHSFTYTANNGKITATCTQGCDKGYDTTPLTLTLTAPASLVYDGNGKAFTFADGEAAAWTGAGLELPTIYYYEKKDYPFYMGIDSAPTDAGGDYMVEITVNKKAARIYFTINKATPYIKTIPAPNDIEYGKKLSDSTLFGGYVQVSSTNTTQVGGLFEWTNGDTKPAVSDSETTEYDVTFTPSSDYEANFTTVTCKVKLKVNRAKTAVEPTVATGLVYDGTEQNGYTNEGNFVTFAGTKVAKSAGDYSFTATPDANYAWSDGTADTKTYNWEIAQKTATVKAVDVSVRTGSTAPNFKVEFTDLLDEDIAAVTEGFDPIFAVMTTGDMPVEIPVEYALKTAGDYTIVITNAEELDAFANYSFIAYTGKFTVIKRSSSSPAGGSVSAEPISYTVSFETNGAGAINSASIEKNATVSEPSAPTKEGYRFIGWYTDKACTNKYNFANKVTKSMTLYAGWDQITSDDNMKDMIMLTIGKTEALAWGEVKNNDVAPIIRNDRTMLPARFVAENLGATVSWDADERKVTITKEGTEILIYIDSDIAYVNGEEVKLDSPAFIENDRTYTPVRFIAESLGAAVEWIEENQQVVITK